MVMGHRAALGGILIVAGMALLVFVGWNRRLGFVALALLSLGWFGIDERWDEIAVLLPVWHGRGLTVIDLPGAIGFVAAVFMLWRHRG